MKPVNQTTTDNCYAACLASILEVPIETVPNFGRSRPSNWLKYTEEWLRTNHNCTLIGFTVKEKSDFYCIPAVHHIMCGISSRGLYHAVVGFQGKMVHDPHPDKGDLTEVWDYEFLFPVEQR